MPREVLSVSFVLFMMLRSVLKYFGPWNWLRAWLKARLVGEANPSKFRQGGGGFPVAGSGVALGLPQLPAAVPPTIWAGTKPPKLSEFRSADTPPSTTVKGRPERVKIVPETVHPLKRALGPQWKR